MLLGSSVNTTACLYLNNMLSDYRLYSLDLEYDIATRHNMVIERVDDKERPLMSQIR